MPLGQLLHIGEGRKIRALANLVPEINALENEIAALSDEDLRGKTVEFRKRLDDGETLDDILVEVFAVVREAGIRALGLWHYDVQLMGGAALHFGWVAEMKTGEGKTLVSTLPVYLNALAGRGVHVVTVNDYLAARDAETMGRLYNFLGLTVGLLSPDDTDPASRRFQYGCDITYGTNKEFGFDYLRDNMVKNLDDKVQRGHFYALVDEVDSILVDEARTPLIISGQTNEGVDLYHKFASIARALRRDTHYDVDEKKKQVAPTEEGVSMVEKILGVENLYGDGSHDYIHFLQAALRAKEIFVRDKDYIIVDGQVRIVDEFTGRTMEGRRWSDGLHQAVEAKEGLRIQGENHTIASVTLQNYFRMYEKLAGMTGTAEAEAGELWGTYGMHVVPIPTHKPMARIDYNDVIYKDEDVKFTAVADEIVERHATGQPVLVGTVSVEKSEKLSALLTERDIPHEVLNAKKHQREAEIIAQAGRLGAVTVSTNMAGRGVDILLGGNPELLAVQRLTAELTVGGNEALNEEEFNTRFMEMYEVCRAECDADGERVRELGGLCVIGTGRHESRRIDDQLRGRSGRQGDPGESIFFLSLDDEIMRVYANAKTLNWALKNATDDGTPLQNKTVNRMVEKAQSTIEAANAETRKDVLKYDDVMNEQRKVVYRMRDDILAGKNLREKIVETLAEVVDEFVVSLCQPENLPEDWNVDALHTEIAAVWPTSFSPEELRLHSHDGVYELLVGEALGIYENLEKEIGDKELRMKERETMLTLLDRNWLEHLSAMDYLREGIGWRGVAQKDPLYEWQQDGYEMFQNMMSTTKLELLSHVLHTSSS